MKIILSLYFSFNIILLAGQNLVPNPSFEQFSNCPDGYFQIAKATPWFSPACDPLRPDAHGFAVFFNGCNYAEVGVPKNNMCFQAAHTGVGYAGVATVSTYMIPNYRQYIETRLTATLKKGKKYYFSMYFNFCNNAFYQPNPQCFNADSTGVFFTTTPIEKNPYCHPLPLKPDVHATLRGLKPSDKWHLIDGCYTAKADEDYLLIGNFGSEDFSSCANVDTLGFSIFVDDVSLIAEKKLAIDTTLCQDEVWKINASDWRAEYKTMQGWTYLWNNGDTSPLRTLTQAGNYKLTVSRNGCFQDVYDLSIKYTNECSCEINVPNAFTPNGDQLNDLFYRISYAKR